MSSITLSARTETHPNLRPLSILRDLPAVADLIEICFSSTMDSDGKRYVQDMRRAGTDNSFANWASRAVETTSLPLSGYVWEQNGKIIGNASLVPFRHNKQRIYLVANIAVHPDHRRQGIAHTLTQRAMQHAREKKADGIWLHVREDNPGAIDLYTKLGFVERARRTTWQAHTDSHAPNLQTDIKVTGRRSNDWQTQWLWLSKYYPELLSWHRKWNFNFLRPGFLNWMYLLFVDINVRQWTGLRKDQMEAALAWIPYGGGEALFAAAGERSDPDALTALLLHARRELAHFYPNITLEFPAGEFSNAIQAAGFKPLRTLIWMQATS
ncbi:MAG: GNAT family N-acetyltransferase [Anaerolineales bacterium]|nr:GNAT family N-acetyltransferase [Anaerolineales bacterium]MBP6209977.1 GNAT family N-acetyltransferase [Anaerolineales bacterium]